MFMVSFSRIRDSFIRLSSVPLQRIDFRLAQFELVGQGLLSGSICELFVRVDFNPAAFAVQHQLAVFKRVGSSFLVAVFMCMTACPLP
jgi:hypothetical protein